jgi:hypothetical protein
MQFRSAAGAISVQPPASSATAMLAVVIGVVALIGSLLYYNSARK